MIKNFKDRSFWIWQNINILNDSRPDLKMHRHELFDLFYFHFNKFVCSNKINISNRSIRFIMWINKHCPVEKYLLSNYYISKHYFTFLHKKIINYRQYRHVQISIGEKFSVTSRENSRENINIFFPPFKMLFMMCSFMRISHIRLTRQHQKLLQSCHLWENFTYLQLFFCEN